MGCQSSSNIKLEPCLISWGKKQKVCVESVTDLAGGEYFKVSTKTAKHVVWFKVNNVGTAPVLLTGETAVEIVLATAYTAENLRAAVKVALEAVGYWIGTLSTDNFFSIEVKEVGVCLLTPVIGTYTGEFTVIVTGIGGDLGKTEGGIEIAMETSTLEIKADQTGETLIDEFITGLSASVSMALLEMTSEQWDLIIGNGVGDSHTPALGTKLVGYGKDNLSRSMLSIAGELVLHPISQGAVKTRDVTFWKCVPMAESINFSGTETQKMSISFKAYLDESKNGNVNLFAFGDGSQDVR